MCVYSFALSYVLYGPAFGSQLVQERRLQLKLGALQAEASESAEEAQAAWATESKP